MVCYSASPSTKLFLEASTFGTTIDLWNCTRSIGKYIRAVLNCRPPASTLPSSGFIFLSITGFSISRLTRLQSRHIPFPCFDSLAWVEIQLKFSNTRLWNTISTLCTCWLLCFCFFRFFLLKGWVFALHFLTPNKHWF